MPRGPARPYPSVSLADAVQLAQAIRDNNAGRPMNRVLLAEALRRSPSSTQFRDMIAGSAKYGFTKGNYSSPAIELTELGERLTTPRSHEERLDALREGLRGIPLFNQILEHFDNSKLPASEFLKNTLERAPFNVAPEWSSEGAEVFIKNGREVGFIRTINDAPYVILEAGPPIERVSDHPEEALLDGLGAVATSDAAATGTAAGKEPSPSHVVAEGARTVAEPNAAGSASSEAPTVQGRQFFVAHGWDKEALGQLQQILNRFHIPYVVAQEEPNAGRPISQKVRDLLKSCSAGIFIFSADEEFKDKDGNSIWRPRENVIYELGAASLEYDQRIVVFKEKSVFFPSDFRDLGYIEYEKGKLDAKAMELLMELVALGAVRITAGS